MTDKPMCPHCADYVGKCPYCHSTQPLPPPHVDDINDAVWRGIERDMRAGLCWACGVRWGSGHIKGCPEGDDMAVELDRAAAEIDRAAAEIDRAAAEIERLRGWLAYIEGNHSEHREAAARALAGETLPKGYEP